MTATVPPPPPPLIDWPDKRCIDTPLDYRYGVLSAAESTRSSAPSETEDGTLQHRCTYIDYNIRT